MTVKSFFPEIRGNHALRHRIGTEFFRHSFSHAYILEGPRGSGKHMLARQLAMAAACENRESEAYPLPCGKCKFCRKIAADNCLDVTVVKRPEDKVTMGVDTIRELRAGIATVPNDLDVKVYVIEDAHTMTHQAQNALLLTLEEPPSFVLFLLLTEDAGSLLETVRSRAPILRLQPIDRDTIREYLLTAPEAVTGGAPALQRTHPEEFEALISLAGGSVGKALTLLDPQTRAPQMEQRAHAEEILQHLAAKTAQDKLLLLFQSFGTGRTDVTGELAMLKLALRDLILLTRAEGAPLLFFTDRERATELSAGFTTERLLAVCAAIEHAEAALAANANVKLTVTRLLSELFTV